MEGELLFIDVGSKLFQVVRVFFALKLLVKYQNALLILVLS